MADEQSVGYGYESDEVVVSPFNFGLNAGKTFLRKFEWIPNGGEAGAEMEALDIVFNINGKDKGYRLFPIKEAFLKNNAGKTTDPTAPEFIAAVKDFNAIITHIVHAFVEHDTYKAYMSRPMPPTFKGFCELVKGAFPSDTPKRALDIFMQYQWQPSKGQNRTYLEIPKKMSTGGAWLKPAQAGEWTEHILDNPKDNDKALWYTNEKGEEHPIWKNGYFMKSKYASKQEVGNTTTSNVAQSSGTSMSALAGTPTANGAVVMPTVTPEAAPQNAVDSNKKVATW